MYMNHLINWQTKTQIYQRKTDKWMAKCIFKSFGNVFLF